MAKTDEEKQEARIQNMQATANLRSALEQFTQQIESTDILCLDEQFKDELIDLRYMMLKTITKSSQPHPQNPQKQSEANIS